MKTWNIIIYCFAVWMFAGCEHDTLPGSLPGKERPLYFTAGVAKSASEGHATREGDNITAELVSVRDTLLKKTFKKGDVIRICNTRRDEERPSFNLDGTNSVYQYVWKEYVGGSGYPEGSDDEDGWVWDGEYDKNSEYLFVPDSISTDVKYGFYASDLVADQGNYFQLYGVWWREFNSGNTMEEPKIKEDQGKIEGFLNSDMMLAYRRHTIDKPYAPVRLVFWHVFAMLDVRITLPVFEEGNEEGTKLPSGYRENEVKLSMRGIPVSYMIASTGENNSGVMFPVAVDYSNATYADDVPMYLYHTSTVFRKKDSKDDEESSYRTYGFCGILPPIKWTQMQEGQPLLRLALRDPVSHADRYYTYTPDRTNSGGTGDGGGTTGSTSLTLEGGEITVLEFSLSRTMDKMEVVQGFVEDWTDAEVDVSVTEVK